MRAHTLIALSIAACATTPSPYETPRVAATGDNVDHYGRPTDPAARACYDRCMRRTDVVDTVLGGASYKTDERQQSACWDQCAARVEPQICDPGDVQSCSCPDPSSFDAPPLPGTRACVGGGTRFGGCDCTPKATPSETPADPAAPPAAAGGPDPCKAAIKQHCVAVCADSPPADRGPCEVGCMREPAESFDGKLKECTPDLAG